MPRLYLLPILFVLLLVLAVSFDHWSPSLIELMKGEFGEIVQPLANAVQLLIWGVIGVIGVYYFIVKKPKNDQNISQSIVTPPSHTRSNHYFQQAYLQALDKRCQFLKLSLIAKPLQERKLQLTLANIYQDQHISVLRKTEQEDQPKRMQTPESFLLMQALDELEHNRLVIRGKVGSGKSSFVNYLTHCLIQSHQGQRCEDLPSRYTRRPVVRLLLRKLGKDLCDDNHSGFIWQAIKTEINEIVSEHLQHQGETALQAGELDDFIQGMIAEIKQQGIVLLDGLDEVSEAENRRANLRKAIESFAEAAPNALTIVTGRPYAYESEKQKLAGFEQADLMPMKPKQIKAFIHHWYQVAREPNSWTEQQASVRANQLADEIANRPYLEEMAETAMLLTLFIGLDYADIRLPSSRAKLYEEAVGLLLQRWHDNLKEYRDELEPAEQEGLLVLERSGEELLKTLKALAYKTYLELEPSEGDDLPLLEFSDETLLGHLSKTFGQSCDHGNLRHFLQFRSGLLVAGTAEETLQFSHKSFHEYLAASHLMSLPKWKDKMEGLLLQNLDWWREVFLLLSKLYSDSQYGEAVQYLQRLLLNRKADDYAQFRLLNVLATAALELNLQGNVDDDEVYKDCYQQLQQRLLIAMTNRQWRPVERAASGRLLGKLGDPRRGVGLIRERGVTLPEIDWVFIEAKAKTFVMGEGNAAHPQTMENDYQLSRYPVTNAQFAAFVDVGGYQTSDYWTEQGWQWVQKTNWSIRNIGMIQNGTSPTIRWSV